MIGVAGKHQQLANTVNGALPAATPVTATVTKVLTGTGQTLVNLGNGNSLILDKAGGKVGDIVKIDLGSQTVIGAPNGSPLLGVGVLSPTGSGNIATISSGALPAGGALPSVIDTAVNAVSGAIAPVLNNPAGALTNPGSTVSNTVGAVTTPVSTITNTVGTVATPVTTVTNTIDSLTSPITAVTGGAAAGGSITTPVTTVTGGAGAGAGVTTTVTNTTGGLVGGLTGGLKKSR